MTKPFNLGTFQDYLNTYGANLARWPENARIQAEDILKESKEAQELYLEILKLDTLFEAGSEKTAPKDLLAKILKNTEK